MKPVSYCLVGGSSPIAEDRRISRRYIDRGADEIDDRCQTAWDRNYRAIHFHNWYGAFADSPGGDMQFDQYWHMRKANTDGRFDKMLDSKAIVMVVRKWVERGMEVTFYVGTLRADLDFKGGTEADNAIYRLYMSLRMPLDAGATIGLDVAYDAKPGDLVYGVMMLLKALGVKYYIEPSPLKTNTDRNEPTVMTYARWEHMTRSPETTAFRFTPETRVIMADKMDEAGTIQTFDKIVAHGHTPMVPSHIKFKVSADGTILEAE